MSFYIYDLIFLVIFGSFLAIFLYKRRKKLQKEGILLLYRTRLGIKVIDRISKKYKKLLNYSEYFLIFIGYALMAGMIVLLFQLLYIFIKFPSFVAVAKIPPVFPLIPYLPQIFNANYLPPFYFTYWIIVLAIAAVSHEFFHGIYVRLHNIKIKSTGFGFLGPFLAFFVEPEERDVGKLKLKNQLAFLSAGVFGNLLVGLLFFVIMWLFFISAFIPSGAIFSSYATAIAEVDGINRIGEENIFINLDGGLNLTEIYIDENKYYIETVLIGELEDSKLTRVYMDSPALRAGLAGVIVEIDGDEIGKFEELILSLGKKKPGDVVEVRTLIKDEEEIYNIQLGEHPVERGRAYLGVGIDSGSGLLGSLRNEVVFFKDPNTYYKARVLGGLTIFIFNLIWWIILVNLSVALVNMLPVGIFDGGRVFFLTILGLTKSERIARKAYKIATLTILLLFLLLTILWFVNFF